MNLKKLIVLLVLPFLGQAQDTAKPWAFWWWPASAVNKADISTNLQSYARAGFGGLHIIPIYGVKGEEAKTITYLSPQWVEILEHTVNEAKKLNLGIDMTLGTGWPYGGPRLKPGFEAQKFKVDSLTYTFISEPTLQKVKRASPGAEGYVMDHFSKPAVENYFDPFSQVFSKKNIGIRAFYNDSYEVYGANWTPDFPAQFLKRRGYSILDHMDTFSKKTNFTELDCRIISDYKETISDLILTEFTQTYTTFSHTHKRLNRNQAHGSPANVLDLYAAVDIPESEFFGSKPYNIPYHYQDSEYKKDRFGEPDWKVLKLASSPANILGKRLVSSETATWLGNHFKVMLSQIKPIIDESFLGGVNHVFYHGITYSPPSEPFPGWLFYASTNFNQNSHFWKELPLLNKYVENCQKLLQNSKPDNEVLVYFPIHDLWQKPKLSLDPVDVHAIKKSGVFTENYLSLLDSLKANGYQFDFVSDRQLATMQLTKNKIDITPSILGTYKAIIIPQIKVLPLATLKQLIKLNKAGILVVFMDQLPQTINGFYNWATQQKTFDSLLQHFKNNVHINLTSTLETHGIKGENLQKAGLSFIRKKANGQQQYFISNLDGKFNSGKIKLNHVAASYTIFDPLSGSSTIVYNNRDNAIDLFLPPGKSVFISTRSNPARATATMVNAYTKALPLKSPWQLDFKESISGKPKSLVLDSLISWSDLPDSLASYFYGEATYTSTFQLSNDILKSPMLLDLGDVRASASVQINGTEIGTSWSYPHTLTIPAGVLKKSNILAITVKNTSFNYVRLLDKNKGNWKKFHDINIVNINYQPFDASISPPEPSGILGPVLLRY